MEHPEEENFPVKRPTFLTVLCILTFIGSGWSILGAFTTYNTAVKTVALYSDSALHQRTGSVTTIDSLQMREDSVGSVFPVPGSDSLINKFDSTRKDTSSVRIGVKKEVRADTVSAEFNMGKLFGEKMKKNLKDMMSVEKLKKSALGSFLAGVFTLGGALMMWFLRKNGFYLYIAGIIIGLLFPFYIYGNNLLAVGIAGFSSFFGLVFIALYALNLKSMR